MALTNFVDFNPPTVSAAWLNGVDKAINGSGTSQGASLIPFQPPGNGSQATTTSAAIRQNWVSVWDFMTPAGIADVQAGTQTIDVGPAFTAMFASGVKHWVVPDGTYWFNSLIPSGLTAYNPTNMLIKNINGFTFDISNNAIFVLSNAANLSSVFLIVQCKHWRITGGQFQGNRTGLTVGNESVLFGLNSVVDFVIENCFMVGDWSGDGTMFSGDWLVNGIMRNCIGDTIGRGTDLAFLQNVYLENLIWQGMGVGLSGPGQIGFSNIFDGVQNTNNNTGVVYTNTNNVFLININATNFVSGFYASSGTDYHILGGTYSKNPGLGGSGGTGIFIDYVNGGTFTSVGNPVQRVFIDSVTMSNNGATVGGPGLQIAGAAITNADLISDIYVRNCNIKTNNNVGVNATGPTHLNNIVIQNNVIPVDATQTSSISTTILNNMVTNTTPRAASVTNNWGFNPTYNSFPALPGGTGSGNSVTNTHPYPVLICIQVNAAAYVPHIVDINGGTDTNLGSVGANTGPTTYFLLPGQQTYFATNVPAGWLWQGM